MNRYNYGRITVKKGVPQGSTRDPLFFNFLFRENNMQTAITMNYVNVQSKNKNPQAIKSESFFFYFFLFKSTGGNSYSFTESAAVIHHINGSRNGAMED